MTDLRIGVGVDAHRLVPERRLVLGGVDIPFDKGLAGHSDADVITHALIDALLGALALGTIGQHFPDSDPAYRGVSSLELLDRAVARVRERGYRVVNVDTVVVAQVPRLAGHLEQMASTLAGRLGVEPSRVSVKATSPEGMGELGRGEGMEAHAVVLLQAEDS